MWRIVSPISSASPDPLPSLGPRIMLRRLRVDDLAAFQAYRAEPELGQYQGWTPMADEVARAFLAQMAMQPFGLRGAWLQLGIVERAGERLIGDIGLCLSAPGQPQQAELGFTLAGAWQGRGLAVEAVRVALALLFGHSEIERVVAITDVRNTASVRLLRAVGMRLCATEAAIFRGEPCEEHWFEFVRPRNEAQARAFPDFGSGA